MPPAIAWLVIGFCLVSGIVALLAVGFWVVEWHQELRAVREANDAEARLKGYVHMLDWWCGYDFPILGDVRVYLMDALDRGVVPDPERFRTKMREKYGARGEKPKGVRVMI